MFQTKITELLGIRYPIIQGGMHWLSSAEFVAAVSNAGGLGILTSAHFSTAPELREEIRKTKDLTDKPFGVNINLFARPMPPVPNEEFIEVMIDEGVTAVETSGVRSPEEYIPRLKEGNIKVIHKVTTLRHAQRAERMGVDAVTVVGTEQGGHLGMQSVGALVLTPLAADALKIPLIAAGGIADGRGFLFALMSGAEGVTIGTRLVATKECPAHPDLKEWLLRARETDTVTVQHSVGDPRRALNNRTADKVLELEQKGASLEDLLPLIGGDGYKKVFLEGDLDAGIAQCGQAVGMIEDIPSVKELIDRIIGDAQALKERFGGLGLS
ncbi:MAG: NAD(P)H-dependent flavin oxidoreductase [Dehalococcoidia bacterium]